MDNYPRGIQLTSSIFTRITILANVSLLFRGLGHINSCFPVADTDWYINILDWTEEEEDEWFDTISNTSKIKYHGTFEMNGDYVDQYIIQETKIYYSDANTYDEDYDLPPTVVFTMQLLYILMITLLNLGACSNIGIWCSTQGFWLQFTLSIIWLVEWWYN